MGLPFISDFFFVSSDKWKTIPTAERSTLEAKKSEDGEFWMSFDDFKKHFTDIEMCSVSIDHLYEDDSG